MKEWPGSQPLLKPLLSIRCWKQSKRSRPTIGDSPKYLSVMASAIMFRMVQTCTLVSAGVHGLKRWWTWPHSPSALKLYNNHPELFEDLLMSAHIKINESSAIRRCDTEGASLHILTPNKFPDSSSYNNRLDRPSAQSKNK